MKPTREFGNSLAAKCRFDKPGSDKEPVLKYIDRAAYSGLNVLLGIIEVLIDYDGNFLSKVHGKDLLSFIDPLVGMDHTKAIKRLKYVTSYWLAKFFHDELPISPDPTWDPWLFKGSPKRYLRQRLVSSSGKNAKLFYSLLQAKRACDPVPVDFVRAQLEKHSKVLAETPVHIQDTLKRKIEDKMDEILAFWPSFEDRQCEPSNSACFECGRCSGGQRRALRRCLGDEPSREYELWQCYSEFAGRKPDNITLKALAFHALEVETGRQFDAELLLFNCFLKFIKEKSTPDDLVAMVEERHNGVPLILERRGWLEPSCKVMLESAAWSEFGLPAQPLPDGSYTDAIPSRGKMSAKTAAICEPLKVRIVTKGRAEAYNACHGIQKWMHSSLRHIEHFRLIGQPVDEELVRDLVFRRICPGHGIVSGDYEGATDHLSVEVTKIIFEKILYRLQSDLNWSVQSYELAGLARKVLYEHHIYYPGQYGIPDMDQKTGQLMGSILSFPILCLANLICCWISLFDYRPLKNVPVIVNGDDIAFSTDRIGYAKWSKDIADFGFIKSVGKNYYSERYLMINSELYDRRSPNSLHLGYFPVGLLLGRHKVAKSGPVDMSLEKNASGELDLVDNWERVAEKLGIQVVKPPPVISTLRLVLDRAQNKRRALLRYISHNREAIQEVVGKRNLFVPEENGGCGIPNCGLPIHLTLWQRRYYSYLCSQRYLKVGSFVGSDGSHSFKNIFKDYRPYDSYRESINDLGFFENKKDPVLCARLTSFADFCETLLPEKQKQYLSEHSSFGPKGWRVLNPENDVKWQPRLPGNVMRRIDRCCPEQDDDKILGHRSYRFSLTRWD
jgi:hypothetical protein